MRVALVKAPREDEGLFSDNSESLALGYLAAAARSIGHEVDLHNAALRRTPRDRLLDALLDDYDFIGFNLPDPTLVRPTIELVDELRAAGVDCHIAVGGHTATFHHRELLSASSFDSVALYEAEDTICELLGIIDRGGDWKATPGLALRNTSGHIVAVPRTTRAHLDDLRWPARDDLAYVLDHRPEDGAVPVLASRGCYFNCTFCSVRAFYEQDGRATWRRRSVGSVLDEIQDLIDRFAVSDILFVDDLFLSRSPATLKYAESFAREVLRRAQSFTFTISATVDGVRRETFELLRESGLRQVFLGAEAASDDILRSLNKWFRPADIAAAVRTLRDLGIDPSVSFINFTPTTRLEHLRQNLDFFSDLDANVLQGLFNRYQVYAGTPLYASLSASGTVTGTFPHFGYVDSDSRVALAWHLCQRAFGALNELHYEVKRLERKSSRAYRPLSGPSPRSAGLAGSREPRELLATLIRGLNRDVRDLFAQVLDFVERQPDGRDEDVESFVRDLRREARTTAGGWLKALRLLEASHLAAGPLSSLEAIQDGPRAN